MADQANGRDEYAEWRAAHHARMPATERTLLAGAVREATGEAPTGWERIVAGEVNEVYGASLPSGAKVVVRVSRQPVTRFASERWALAAARDVGLPVPDMLHLVAGEDPRGTFWICVENRLAGHALEEVAEASARERIAGLAGELVATLHTIAVTGFGYLRGDGTGPSPSWARVMRSEQSDEQLARTVERAARFGVPAGWVRTASAELHRHDDLFAPVESRLLHGDLSSAHVLTDGTTVTGLIDFEQAFGGDPAFELVRWSYFREDSPLDWLLAGYRRVADAGPELELRIRLGRLRLHLALADFHAGTGHPLAGRAILRRFAEDAAWFGFDEA